MTLIGLTSIVGSRSATRVSTVFLPKNVAATTSPHAKSSRLAAAVAGARTTTSAHASSHPGMTTVRVMTIAILLRYYQGGEGRVHNRTEALASFTSGMTGDGEPPRRSLLDHLNNADANGLAKGGPLSFSFEVVPAAGRVTRRRALIAQLAPGLVDDGH